MVLAGGHIVVFLLTKCTNLLSKVCAFLLCTNYN
nr:MAG TPA: hypothetical protein [Caudoviricetes sp.]